jgi:REP element-mobilizing transposase RayT
MSEFIHKRHNASVLLYHIVCPAKYRKAIFTAEVDEKLKEICAEIAVRYEIEFLGIGTDSDHVHFLVQSVPKYSPTRIVRTIKSITAKEIFRQMPKVKKQLWGGDFRSDGYYLSAVGALGSEEMIKHYFKQQGAMNESMQPTLF